MNDWLKTLHDELAVHGEPIVRVVIAGVRGSAPRDPGACMLVTRDREVGTIGGGHLEFVATRIARDLLGAAAGASRLDQFSLGASLGQCCGGIVELWFQRHDANDIAFLARVIAARDAGTCDAIAGARLMTLDQAARESADLEANDAVLARGDPPTLYERVRLRDKTLWLFGAGHVARHLVTVLAPLPFAIRWVDSREGMHGAGLPPSVTAIHSPEPADEVRAMGDGDWALVMTHSHDEDFAICEQLLADGRFGWAGVIGSAPKTKRFRQRLAQRGFTAAQVARITMPIGIDGIGGKEPAAIAIAVAAQLLQLREARVAAGLRSVRES